MRLAKIGTTLESGAPVTVCPDMYRWQPGDVLLSNADKTLPGGAAIKAYHWALRDRGLAQQWTHVTLYVGRGKFYDAQPGTGVRPRVTGDVLEPHFEYALMRPRMTCADWEAFDDNCLEAMGLSAYRVWSHRLWARYVDRLRRVWAPRRAPLPGRDPNIERRVTCASFAARMLEMMAADPDFLLEAAATPADFTDPARFRPVSVTWTRPPIGNVEKPLAA